jgi:hypothetical protein
MTGIKKQTNKKRGGHGPIAAICFSIGMNFMAGIVS